MVKFLIIRFSSIGDIILTTPVIRGLKNQVEDSEVHYLTKAKFASVLADNPYIDKLHTLDNNFSALIKELKKENFDYIIDLHKNIRTLRFKNSLKRVAFSFNKLNFQKWLMVNFKINKLPNAHIVDRYLETVSVFSVENDGKGLDFFIRPEDKLATKEFADIPDEPYLVIVAGGGHFTKQVPENKMIELINQLNWPIVLIGGKEDAKKANSITEKVNKKIINLTGTMNLGQSASVIKQASLIITPDTGMMHIAAAFKKDIFSLWGNTIPEFGMSAYQSGPDSEIFEVKGLSCRPCSKIGFSRCPKKHFKCMYEQNINSLVSKTNLYFQKLSGNNSVN